MPEYRFSGIPKNWPTDFPCAVLTKKEKKEILLGYVKCLCWVEEGPDTGNPVPLIPEKHFYRDEWDSLLEDLGEIMQTLSTEFYALLLGNPELFGHNLFLSRNRHGSGFFDEDEYPVEARKVLQEWAGLFGEVSILAPGDGRRKCSIWIDKLWKRNPEKIKNFFYGL